MSKHILENGAISDSAANEIVNLIYRGRDSGANLKRRSKWQRAKRLLPIFIKTFTTLKNLSLKQRIISSFQLTMLVMKD